MQVQVRGRNIALTEALREHVDRRLHFALSRFGDRIGRIPETHSAPGVVPGGSHIATLARQSGEVLDQPWGLGITHPPDTIYL